MIQIKQFKKKADIEEVNKFLSENLNCKILQHDPYVIQYEVPELYTSPVVLSGMPVPVSMVFADEFEDTRKLVEFNCSQVLVFDDYVLLRKQPSMYQKLSAHDYSLGVSDYYPKTGREYNNTPSDCVCSRVTVGEYAFHNKRDFSVLDLANELLLKGMSYENSKLLYQNRTNTLVDVAHIEGEYRESAAEIGKPEVSVSVGGTVVNTDVILI